MLLFIFILSSCNRIKIDNINNNTSIETSIDELISYEKDSFIAPASSNQNGIKIYSEKEIKSNFYKEGKYESF